MKKNTLRTLLLTALVAVSVAGTNTPPAAPLTEYGIRDCYHASYRYEKSQSYADAIKSLAPVVTAYPEGYTVNLRLGWLHYLSGNYANAKANYQTAIKVEPGSIEAKLGYTLPLIAQERYDDVESVCRQILILDPSNYYANLRLSFSLRMKKKIDQAEEVLNRTLALYPTDVSLLSELALVRLAQNRTDEARRIFSDVSTLDPENVLAKSQLAALNTTPKTNAPATK